MDENKNARGEAGGTKPAPDPHGKQRHAHRGKFRNNRGKGGKPTENNGETKTELQVKAETHIKLENNAKSEPHTKAENGSNNGAPNGKNHAKNGRPNGRHENSAPAPEQARPSENREAKQPQKNQQNQRPDRRPNDRNDKPDDRNGRTKPSGAKQNDNRPHKNKGTNGTNGKNGKNERNGKSDYIPPNVIDDDAAVFLPEYMLSPFKKKAAPEPVAEPEIVYAPGEYKFPDDTGQIVFGDAPEEKPLPPEPAEPVETVEIVDVRFKLSGKTYFFSPNGLTLQKDDKVIVETARGLEFGTVVQANRFVPISEIVPPLKNVLRVATPEDVERRRINEEKEIDAFNVCLQKIEEHGLEMKLVDVEFTFDNSKLLFYFSADGRVDFRELARDLASVFRTRIELRQIGIRDEAKMLGGIGICGRPLCCNTWLSDFGQVSIKMAKEQSLSLNSSKISGTCGRLMCCLRYEYGTYVEELSKTPRVDTLVETPDGIGIVTEISPLAGLVKVRMQDNPDQPPRYYNRADLKQIAPAPSAAKQIDEAASEGAACPPEDKPLLGGTSSDDIPLEGDISVDE